MDTDPDAGSSIILPDTSDPRQSIWSRVWGLFYILVGALLAEDQVAERAANRTGDAADGYDEDFGSLGRNFDYTDPHQETSSLDEYSEGSDFTSHTFGSPGAQHATPSSEEIPALWSASYESGTAADARNDGPGNTLMTELPLDPGPPRGIPHFRSETPHSPPRDWLNFGGSDSSQSDYSDEYSEGPGPISQISHSPRARHATLSERPTMWPIVYEPRTTRNDGPVTSPTAEAALGPGSSPRAILGSPTETSFSPPYDWLDFREPGSAGSDDSTVATHLDDFDFNLPSADYLLMGDTYPAVPPNPRLTSHVEPGFPRGFVFGSSLGQQFANSNNLGAYRFPDPSAGNTPSISRPDSDFPPTQGQITVMVRRSGLLDVPWTEGMPENTQCPICYETKVANTFSCTGLGTPHGVCNSCFKGLTGGSWGIAFKCPICRATIPRGWQ